MTAGEKYGGRGLDGMATVLCLRVPRPCEVGLFRRPDAPATSAHTLRAPLGSPTLETCSKWVQSKISFLDIHIHVSLPFASTVLELSSSTHVITADLHVHVHVHRVGPRGAKVQLVRITSIINTNQQKHDPLGPRSAMKEHTRRELGRGSP